MKKRRSCGSIERARRTDSTAQVKEDFRVDKPRASQRYYHKVSQTPTSNIVSVCVDPTAPSPNRPCHCRRQQPLVDEAQCGTERGRPNLVVSVRSLPSLCYYVPSPAIISRRPPCPQPADSSSLCCPSCWFPGKLAAVRIAVRVRSVRSDHLRRCFPRLTDP